MHERLSRPAPPKQPRRWVWLKRAVVATVVLTLLCVVVAVGWIRSDDFQRRVQTLAETTIERTTGEQLSVTRVDVGFWPPGIEIRGFNLFHAPTGDTIVRADRASLPIRFDSHGPKLGNVELHRPSVHLHLDGDGLREFQSAAFPKARKPLGRLPLDGLSITNGRFELTHPRGSLRLDAIYLVPDGLDHQLALDLLVDSGDLHSVDRWATTVRLEPDGVVLPDVAFDTSLARIDGPFRFRLPGQVSGDLTLRADLARLTPALTAPRALHGVLHADLQVRGTTRAPEVAVNVFGEDLGFDGPAKVRPLIRYRFEDVALAAEWRRDRVVIEDIKAFWGGGLIRGAGVIDPSSMSLVDSRVVGSRVSLAKMLTQFDGAPNPWVDFDGDAEVRLSGSLKPLRLEGPFDLAVADLLVADRPVASESNRPMLKMPRASARGSLLLEKSHITLDATDVRGPKTRGTAWIDIGFSGIGPLDIRANLQADLSDFGPLGNTRLGGIGPIQGRIWGPFKGLQFEGRGEVESFQVLGFPFADRLVAPVLRSEDLRSIELVGASATVGRSTYTGDFRFDFRRPFHMDTDLAMPDGRIEDINRVFVDMDSLTGRMGGNLSIHGPIDALNARADFQLADVDLFDEHFGRGRARGTMVDGAFTLDGVDLYRGGQRLSLAGRIREQWGLDLRLTGRDLTLEETDAMRAIQLDLTSAIDLDVAVNGTLFSPEPSGQVVFQNTRLDGRELQDSVIRLQTTSGIAGVDAVLLGNAIQTRGTVQWFDEQRYAFDGQLNALPAHVFYPNGADGSPITAVADGHFDIAGRLGDATPTASSATLTDVHVQWDNHDLHNDDPWTFTQTGPSYRIDHVDLVGGQTHVSVTATGDQGLQLEGDGTIDLDLLRSVVPGLERARGIATIDVDVEGSGPDVQTVADLNIEADLIRYESVPVAFEEIEADLVLTESMFDLQRLKGSVGGGRIEGGGRILATSWSPTRFDLRADIHDAQVRWLDTLPPAIGDASLTFDGPSDALLLSGDITVDEMAFTERIDWEDWVVEYRTEVLVGSSSNLSDEQGWFDLNVNIDADQTLRLRNNLADGTASADLTLVGDTARPGLIGSVRVDDAVVVLQDREFRVDRGEAVYNDPFSWDPLVDFDLVTDIESRSQRYRIDYQLYGPFSNWRTSTRSDPALPQADVNALLWFGVTTDELEQSGELPTAVAQGVADLLLTDLFASTQASELGEVPEVLFDRIDVATGVNGRGEYSAEPRLVVSKRLTDLGDFDLTWEFNLGRPEDNYVRLDRRVGGVWSIAGWYATLQRERVLPIGGAYGLDVTARWESE